MSRQQQIFFDIRHSRRHRPSSVLLLAASALCVSNKPSAAKCTAAQVRTFFDNRAVDCTECTVHVGGTLTPGSGYCDHVLLRANGLQDGESCKGSCKTGCSGGPLTAICAAPPPSPSAPPPPPPQITTGAGSAPCVGPQLPSCQPGNFAAPQASKCATASCTQCTAGQYQNARGASACKVCSRGSVTVAAAGSMAAVSTGATACRKCAAGQVSNDPKVSCSKCMTGRFQPSQGQTTCQSCQRGSTTNTLANVGAISCQKCPVGRFSALPTTACATCGKGSGTDTGSQPGGSTCTACAAGRYSAKATDPCQLCAAGSTTDTLAATGASMCTACQPGKSSVISTVTCSDCVAGQFQSSQGQSSCQGCPAGSVTDKLVQSGATRCRQCSAGQFSPASYIQCANCRAGTVPNAPSRDSCVECGAGKYQRGTRCEQCAAGQYQSAKGQTSCVQCTAGSITDGPRTRCTRCAKGRYSASPTVACAQCSVGQYQGLTGQSQCLKCQVGSVTEVAIGALRCTRCPVGKFGSSQSTTQCSSCPAGSTAPTTQSVSIAQCVCKRYYQPKLAGSPWFRRALDATLGCEPITCAENEQVRDHTCIPCPSGMTKSAGEAISVTNAQALKCASGKCDQPVLTNATHRIKAGSCRSKQSAGAECELECAVGHITASSRKGICKLDSSSGKLVYSGQSLVCRAATCAKVARPSGGTVIKTGTCLAHGAQNSQRHVCIFECAPGYFRKLQAQESSNEQVGLCKPIAKGARYVGQRATCAPCPAGSFRALSGQYTMCEQCAAGQYQNMTQQTRCHVCSPGSFQDRAGQINCKSCPTGQSQSRASSIKCYLCSPGKYQSAVGQQACLSCTPGSTTDTVANPGATQCSTCAAGKFSASAQTKCVQCAHGKVSGSPGMTQCKRCPDGHSSNQQATSCAKTKCVALSTKLLHSIDVHAVIRAGSCVAGDHGSTCHLTCVDGYTVRNAVPGVCSADMGSSSSSYKNQSVKCVPSQCAAVPVLAPRKVLYGCGNGTMLNDIKSTCLLGCMDGYRAADGSIAPGQCLPNSGLPTASVQGHSISCIPQLCDAPTLRVGQTIINGCAGTPGLHNDNAMGKTCLLGCGSGYRNRTHYELGVCRPVLGRPTAAYQWTHQPVECEPVNVCNDDGFAINSFKDFCHVNSSCVTSGLPGSARCICNPGSTGRVMEINVTFRVATRTNIIAQVTSGVLPKAHCSLIPCPAYSSGWGGGSQCVCTGNYSGSIKWSKQRNVYLGSCSRCDPEQGSVPDPSGTMCWCMKGWTWTGTRCRRCEIGSFKDEVSNAACNLCKHTASGPGSTTRTEGSTSKRDCVCNEGHFNVSRGRIKCEHELASGIDDEDTKSVSAQFECQRCPACAICLIDDEFYPAVNYWTFDPKQVDRTSDETKGDMFTTGRLIFACNNGRGCVCSASNGSALAVAVDEIGCTGTSVNDCAVGYHGVACGECDRAGNFGRYGQRCVECASWVFTLLIIVMAVLLVCLVLFFRMKAASGTRVGVRKSRMIPIFMAYLQVTWCVGAFKLQWPTLASRFFTSAGVATGSSLSFIDCYIPTTFYDQFLLMCSIPLAAVLVPLARHCTFKEIDARQRLLCRSSAAFAADAKGNPPKTMLFFLIVVVIMHPGITKNALEMFNCRTFEHEYRLELD
eukprot:COSAG01_NODE_2811_length_7034_cov_2.875270_1_plen_1653_part_10